MEKKAPPPKRESFLNSSTMKQAKEKMAQLDKMMEDIDKKIDLIQEKSGVNIKKLQAVFNNPSNFSPAQWELMQQEKEKFTSAFKKLEESLNKPNAEKIKGILKGENTEKRGRKLRGARQKWIPM